MSVCECVCLYQQGAVPARELGSCREEECHVCAFMSDRLSLPAQKEEWMCCLCLPLQSVLYMGATQGSALSVYLAVSVCLRVYVSGTCAQLPYQMNLQM